MKEHMLYSFIFGFVFAGSLNAMGPAEKHIDDAKKYEKYAREFLENSLMMITEENDIDDFNDELLLQGLSEEAHLWFFRCSEYGSIRFPTDAEEMSIINECTNPISKVINDPAFEKYIVHNSLNSKDLSKRLMIIEQMKKDNIYTKTE